MTCFSRTTHGRNGRGFVLRLLAWSSDPTSICLRKLVSTRALFVSFWSVFSQLKGLLRVSSIMGRWSCFFSPMFLALKAFGVSELGKLWNSLLTIGTQRTCNVFRFVHSGCKGCDGAICMCDFFEGVVSCCHFSNSCPNVSL